MKFWHFWSDFVRKMVSSNGIPSWTHIFQISFCFPPFRFPSPLSPTFAFLLWIQFLLFFLISSLFLLFYLSFPFFLLPYFPLITYSNDQTPFFSGAKNLPHASTLSSDNIWITLSLSLLFSRMHATL